MNLLKNCGYNKQQLSWWQTFLSTVVFGGAKPQTEFEKKQFDTHFNKKILNQ
jgi:hypothetical protein